MNSNDTFIKTLNESLDNEIMSKDKEYGLELNKTFFHNFVEAFNNDRYKGRVYYYKNKFNFDIDNPDGKNELKKLITQYFEGLQWNLFYFKGYLSINWNYLYHYCPLISDMAKYDYKNNLSEIIYKNINEMNGDPLTPYILHCLIFPSFDLIPENYHKIINLIPEYYNYKIKFDNNGSPFKSQIIIISPKIKDKKILKELSEFGKIEFPKSKNYNIIKEIYGKEYLYKKGEKRIEHIRERKNEIFKENYENKKVDIVFPSLESISNYKYIEGYFKRNIDGNKIKEINSLFIYVNLDEKKYKKINKIIINDIFKEKIISYGYPFIKLGILNGLYYDDKYYSIDENTKIIKQINCQYKYEEQLKKIMNI